MKARLLQPPLCTTSNRRAGCPFEATAGWLRYPLALAVLTFAVSTMISWAYYGLKGWTYLFGEGRINEYAYLLTLVVKAEYLQLIAKVESGEFKRYR